MWPGDILKTPLVVYHFDIAHVSVSNVNQVGDVPLSECERPVFHSFTGATACGITMLTLRILTHSNIWYVIMEVEQRLRGSWNTSNPASNPLQSSFKQFCSAYIIEEGCVRTCLHTPESIGLRAIRKTAEGRCPRSLQSW